MNNKKEKIKWTAMLLIFGFAAATLIGIAIMKVNYFFLAPATLFVAASIFSFRNLIKIGKKH